MTPKYPQDAIIVTTTALASKVSTDVVASNVYVVNSQIEQYFKHEDISTNALQSYYVDYFLAQLNNGGFSQFVYNSGWGACIEYITDGFAAMGAHNTLELFENAALKMRTRPGIEGLKKFFASEYFGDNPERDILNEFNAGFYALGETEDLAELNAAWLRSLPNLIALSETEIDEEITQRAAALRDRKAQIAEQSRHKKLIRALCAAAGQEFNCITVGNPSYQYQDQSVVAWNFLTDQGHHQMIDIAGRAIMFKGHTTEIVTEIDAGPEFGVN